MSETELIKLVSTSFCQAVMLEPLDAEPGRFFVGYRRRYAFTDLLGHGVVDEFQTISGPLFVCPRQIIGGIYDSGMRLADLRDVEAPIDQGWPPLTIGVDVIAPPRPDDWQQQLLDTIISRNDSGKAPWSSDVQRISSGKWDTERLRCHTDERLMLSVIVTSAPMLPQQLERLADRDDAPLTVAISTGNRLGRVENDELHVVSVISELELGELAGRLAG